MNNYNSNNGNVRKRAPGERVDDGDMSKRIRSLMEAGQTQEALVLRAQQMEHHQQQQQQPYPALDSAQQQLALAIARRKQSEQEVYLRQQEVQQAATMAEWASRQQQQQQQHGVGVGVGPAALLGNRKYFYRCDI